MIQITQQMRLQANQELKKRDPHISHHFQVEHMTSTQRDEVGFLGEFACCEFFGIDWLSNIRKDYLTIDSCDFRFNGYKIDVKTETLPRTALEKVYKRTIHDNETWGRRLINQHQVALLRKYDVVVFGGFVRGVCDYWYPFGYLETSYILDHYSPTNQRPDGGTYPSPALAIKTSDLKAL